MENIWGRLTEWFMFFNVGFFGRFENCTITSPILSHRNALFGSSFTHMSDTLSLKMIKPVKWPLEDLAVI